VTPAPLGPLAAFTDNWIGSGFNLIFLPNGKKSPAGPFPVRPLGPYESVLELNLNSETLSFAPKLSIPNRGFGTQEDMFLNGVPYVQSINDVTTPRAFISSRGSGLAFRRSPRPKLRRALTAELVKP